MQMRLASVPPAARHSKSSAQVSTQAFVQMRVWCWREATQ
jgi:hypothetical protein